MQYPEFFESIEAIEMFDPLAKVLGVGDGMMRYEYIDAVKLAGHSCPTVAGAWLCVKKAIELLFEDQIPTRGLVSVKLAQEEDEGVAGVIASIATLILGASGKGGFKGLKGHFARNDLLHFGGSIGAQIAFTHNETGKTVALNYDPSPVAVSSKQQEFMGKIMSQSATEVEVEEFGRLWQERVRLIFENYDRLIHIV